MVEKLEKKLLKLYLKVLKHSVRNNIAKANKLEAKLIATELKLKEYK